MRRFLYISLLAGFGLLHAQEAGKTATARQEDDNLIWKVANFAIFAGGIGFVVWKYSPAFFNARSADIQRAIKEATGLKMDADLRYSEIDRKMADLNSEVARLRAESQLEMEREYERMKAHTREEIGYIERGALSEIDALRGEGADKLRVHATHRALALAELRLRERLAASDQKDLVGDFLHLVESAGAQRGNN